MSQDVGYSKRKCLHLLLASSMADHREDLRERSSSMHTVETKKAENLALESLEALQPDLVLVYSSESTAEIKKGLETLSNAGYFATTIKGAATTTLILVRAGAGLVVGSSDRSVAVQRRLSLISLPGVTDRFPPHNAQNPFTNSKMKELQNSRSVEIEADNIEAILGPQAAGAIEFENYMLRLFALFAVSGVQQYFLKGRFAFASCAALLLTGTVGVAFWTNFANRRKAQRAVDTSQIILNKRPEYKGTPAERREQIRLLFVPFAALLMTLYGLGLVVVLAFEIFCTQIYDGPAKGLVKLFPVGANVVASQVYAFFYSIAIDRFTEWEDYPTEEALNNSKAQRQFYLQALIGYMPIILTAYVYLPFGHLLIGLVKELHNSQLANYLTLTETFQLDGARLYTQARFYTLTQSLVAVALDGVLPWIIYAFKRNVLHKARESQDNRFALEQLKVPFNSNTEIQKVVLSFGYLLIVSSIWPFAAVVAFVLLYARKMAVVQLVSRGFLRKPLAYSFTRDIAFWTGDLFNILLAGSIVAPTICIMYCENRSSYDYRTSYVDTTWPTIALVALLSENAVLVVYRVALNYLQSLDSFAQTTSSQTTEKSLPEKTPSANSELLNYEQDKLWSELRAHSE